MMLEWFGVWIGGWRCDGYDKSGVVKGEMYKNCTTFWFTKSTEISLGKHWCKWKDNTKMDLRKLCGYEMDV